MSTPECILCGQELVDLNEPLPDPMSQIVTLLNSVKLTHEELECIEQEIYKLKKVSN